jgi:5'-nucleotidase
VHESLSRLRGARAGVWRRAWGAAAACALLALHVAGPLAAGQAPAPAASTIVSVVGTNDLHGGILPRDGRGGLALLAGYVRNLRKVRSAGGGAVLLVDGGDMFQGTLESNLTEGATVIAAYNTIGYTAAAIGNHEFDFGPEGPASIPAGPDEDPRGALKARAAEARFPLLAANLIDAGTGQPVSWPNVKPAVLVEAAGLKAGIIGLITSEAMSATTPANVAGLRVAPLAPAIVEYASRLRAQGATIVIVTAHAGGRCGSFADPADLAPCDQAAEIIAVARALPRGLVDVIVGGHTHAGMAHEVNGIAIVQAFANGRAFGRVDVTVDRASGTVTAKRIFPPRDLCALVDPRTGGCDTPPRPGAAVQATYEGAPVVPDPEITTAFAATLAKVTAIKARSLGIVLETPIHRLGRLESPLGNLFTDALRDSVPGADAAIHNTTGGLRADLPQGPAVYGSVYEVMPFDNKVVTLALTGRELRTVFAIQLQKSRRLVSASGIHIQAGCANGAIQVTLVRPSGAPIADGETLRVVVNDFLAMGGDDILTPVIPPGGFAMPGDGPLARDVLADYLTKAGGRLREEQLVDAAHPRLTYAGTLPVTCG